MRGDRAVAQKAVEIETFVDIELQPLLGTGVTHAGRRRHGHDADAYHHERAAQERLRVRSHRISSRKINSEDEGRSSMTGAPSCISNRPVNTRSAAAPWSSNFS